MLLIDDKKVHLGTQWNWVKKMNICYLYSIQRAWLAFKRHIFCLIEACDVLVHQGSKGYVRQTYEIASFESHPLLPVQQRDRGLEHPCRPPPHNNVTSESKTSVAQRNSWKRHHSKPHHPTEPPIDTPACPRKVLSSPNNARSRLTILGPFPSKIHVFREQQSCSRSQDYALGSSFWSYKLGRL